MFQAGVIRLERSRLPALRAAFKDALTSVEELILQLGNDGYLPEAWLGDEVSIETANYYNERVMGPQGTPFAALVAYQTQLKRVIDAIDAVAKQYEGAEGANASRWVLLSWNAEVAQ